MTDPLAQFRKRPGGMAVPPTGEGEGYAAFGAKVMAPTLVVPQRIYPQHDT